VTSLKRNLAAVLALILLVWASFLAVSYVISVTVFYTLEHYPRDIVLSVLRVVIGLSIAGAWIIGWYALTKIWLYKVLLK